MVPVSYAEFVAELVPSDDALRENFACNIVNHLQVLHAALGMSTEANELLDNFKAALYKAKPIDWVNLDEEAGDLLFFLQLYCNERGLTLADLMAINKAKLAARYKQLVFNNEEASNRDLGQERKVLEAASEQQQNREG